MNKKFAILFTFIFLSVPCTFADDLWDNYADQSSYNSSNKQKYITDDEFEKALKSKQGQRRNKNIPKGNEFHQANETNLINQTKEDSPVLCIPIKLLATKDATIPIGHYQVIGEKKDGKPYIKLYQAHDLIVELPAIETTHDYDQKNINFVTLKEIDNNNIVIIYGSLDFNAYSVLNIAE